MTKRRKIIWFLLAVFWVSIAFQCDSNENSEDAFKKNGIVTFKSAEGEFLTKIDVELANTDTKRRDGLMHRSEMKENQGMLFVFPDENYRDFWMKNTILSLDIMYADKEGRIVSIAKNTTPYSEASIPSEKPAQYVVEVNAGFCDKYKIEVNDKIFYEHLK